METNLALANNQALPSTSVSIEGGDPWFWRSSSWTIIFVTKPDKEVVHGPEQEECSDHIESVVGEAGYEEQAQPADEDEYAEELFEGFFHGGMSPGGFFSMM